MDQFLIYAATISSMIAFQVVIGNNNSNNNQNVIVVQTVAKPEKEDVTESDPLWVFLVIVGLAGFLMYLYALSPELFTDLLK